MNPRLTIQTQDLEVDKPSGGGRGAKVLYIIEVLIDGEVALHLQSFHFKKPGQKLKKQIVALRQEVLPKSALGKACDYALGQWSRVVVYASHGEVEIDKNWCENAVRPVALGRKNWLHIGSEEAGSRIAAISSVIETCRRLGINPREYLLDVLPRIPSWPAKRIAELTPMAWAAQHSSP